MTDKEKLEKIKKLADDMYYAAANLGPNVGSGERLRKTMEEYYKFIIHEYNKEEPKNDWWLQELHNKLDSLSKEDFDKVWAKYHQKKEPVSEDLEQAVNAYIGYAPEVDESSSTYGKRQAFKAGAQWKEQQLVAKAVKVKISNAGIVSLPLDCNLKVGDKVLLIKE